MTSAKGSELMGFPVYLKLESLQKTGSFKIRGAFYKLWKLARQQQASQVMAISAGNHAQDEPVRIRGFLSLVVNVIASPEGEAIL